MQPTQLNYYLGGTEVFNVRIPVGAPIPRVGDYVEVPLSDKVLRITEMKYKYPTDMWGVTTLVFIHTKEVRQ